MCQTAPGSKAFLQAKGAIKVGIARVTVGGDEVVALLPVEAEPIPFYTLQQGLWEAFQHLASPELDGERRRLVLVEHHLV
jgi:hypothetical protein